MACYHGVISCEIKFHHFIASEYNFFKTWEFDQNSSGENRSKKTTLQQIMLIVMAT